MKLTIRDKKFFLDNEPIKIYSGAIHYFRIPQEYWRDRLEKLKACGFNTVETYVCWNLHEPKKGEFRFDGMLDLVEFLKIAQEIGLYAIVRPGPYICAEWDFGGFPAWLLTEKGIRFRLYDEIYLQHVSDWYKKLFSLIADMQSTRGGNIIAIQVENEYGSYGDDKKYLAYLKDLMIELGTEVLLFTADGNSEKMVTNGRLEGLYQTLTFGSGVVKSFELLNGIQDDCPKMCMEFWDGWFDHWSEKHHVRDSKSVMEEIKAFIDNDACFNMYMFHGGTNFGFTSGANYAKGYQPIVTSYDYNSPVSEWGGYTDLYRVLREFMLKERGIAAEDLPLPAAPKFQNVGKVKLDKYAYLPTQLAALGEEKAYPYPVSQEDLGQNSGYVWYSTELKQDCKSRKICIKKVRDLAYLFVDGKLKKRFWRNDKPLSLKISGQDGENYNYISPKKLKKGTKIDILVECMGHVNYGQKIYDPKGISDVYIDNVRLEDWNIRPLPMDDISKLDFSEGEVSVPCFLKGTFSAQNNGECFVHMNGFAKGFVFVNGHNLGRYWDIGPQKALYIPGCWLNTDRDNEIIIFEQEKYKAPEVIIDGTPDLGK